MRIFGLTIARTKDLQLSPISASRSGWWPYIRESFVGAWQQNVTVVLEDVLTHPTAWSCITLIAADVSKNIVRLVQPDADRIWSEVENPAYSPVLKKPNHYQTRIDFFEQWMISKLTRGNTYVLLQRDRRRVVTAMYILDPSRVTPMVAPDGGVYYQLQRDDLSGLPNDMYVVPASEIMHDRMNALYHPLVGLSPIYACGLAAVQGLRIQTGSANFFANGSNPGGVLTAPGAISQETADRLKAYWEANFNGTNIGKLAVLGDGLKFDKMTMTAVDSELVKQLGWSDEKVCSCFHVPPHLVGVGPSPTYSNIEALARQYYGQCLQIHFERIELLLDEGLGLLPRYGAEFDLDNLLRMDSATMMATLKEGVGAAILTPNEARQKLNIRPVEGGETPYLQEQNWPLRLLAGRTLPPERPPTAPAPLPPSGLDERTLGKPLTKAAEMAANWDTLDDATKLHLVKLYDKVNYEGGAG